MGRNESNHKIKDTRLVMWKSWPLETETHRNPPKQPDKHKLSNKMFLKFFFLFLTWIPIRVESWNQNKSLTFFSETIRYRICRFWFPFVKKISSTFKTFRDYGNVVDDSRHSENSTFARKYEYKFREILKRNISLQPLVVFFFLSGPFN